MSSILSRGFVVLSDDQAYNERLRVALPMACVEAPVEIRKTTRTRPLGVPMGLEASGA